MSSSGPSPAGRNNAAAAAGATASCFAAGFLALPLCGLLKELKLLKLDTGRLLEWERAGEETGAMRALPRVGVDAAGGDGEGSIMSASSSFSVTLRTSN